MQQNLQKTDFHKMYLQDKDATGASRETCLYIMFPNCRKISCHSSKFSFKPLLFNEFYKSLEFIIYTVYIAVIGR